MAVQSPIQHRLFISAEELCREAGISQKTLQRMERDPHDPLVPCRPGGWKRVFRVDEVLSWLDRHRTHPGNTPPPRNPQIEKATEASRKARRRRARKAGAR